VTLAFPGIVPAVNVPSDAILPPVAFQVTACSESPLTFAVNRTLWRIRIEAVAGEILICPEDGCPLCCSMVSVAVADLLASAALVAVTVAGPAVWPAVNTPVEVIVPPVAVQVTAVSLVPLMLALKV
jgi:hypothetical protein